MNTPVVSCLLVLVLVLVSYGQAPQAGPGWVMELFSSNLPVSGTRDIEVVPAGFGAWAGDLVVAWVGSFPVLGDGALLRVDAGSGVSLLAPGSAAMPDPLSLAFGPGGSFGTDLYVNSNNDPAAPTQGLLTRFGPAGTTTVFGSPTPAGFWFGAVDLAFSPGGPFGEAVYTGASGGLPGDAISRLPASGGAAALFHTFGPGGEHHGSPVGTAFGPPGSPFGQDLHFGVLRVGPGLPAGIYSLDPAGARTTLVDESAPLVTSVLDIAFSPGGGFGQDLYATDDAGTVLRVDATGGIGLVASGFTSGGWLAFGPGGLYVSDPDAGTIHRIRPAPGLAISQPGGPGAPVSLMNTSLVPGHEYWNVFSLDPCPAGPGAGPHLGLCASTPAALQALAAQVTLPLGTPPFHYQAPAASQTFGPFAIPPVTVDALLLEAGSGTLIGSPVLRFAVQ